MTPRNEKVIITRVTETGTSVGVTLDVDAGLGVITIDRPDVRNAIGFATIGELDRALDDALAADVAALVIRGAGDRAFVSGGDLKELATIRTHDDAVAMARTVRRLLDRVASFPVPVLAALNGHALGGGAEVAIAADIRIAADDVKIGFNQVTLGIMPAWGGAERLAQVVGRGRAMLAIAEGRLLEGEALTERRYELGKEALLMPSVSIYRCQRHALQDLKDDLAPVESEIAELVELFPARPVFRSVLAQVHARTGRIEEAAHALSELTTALPFDQEWLYGMCLLAETAVLVDDEVSAANLYESLTPWAELNAVDVAEGCRGAVSRYLGLLAEMLGRQSEAAAHFGHAIAANERMGFVPWAARARGLQANEATS